MRRLLFPLCAAVALALPAAAAADPIPTGATWTEAYIPSSGVTLHADVLRPTSVPKDAKTPVILSIGPYFGQSDDPTDPDPTAEGPTDRFPELWKRGKMFEKGYTWVQVDLRGFGASTGCNDF